MIAVVVVVVGERAALSPNVEGSVRVRLGGGDDDAKSLSSLLLSLSSVGRSDCRCLLQRFDMLRMMMMIDDVSVLSVPPILDSQITTNQTTGRFGHDSYNQCVSKDNPTIHPSNHPTIMDCLYRQPKRATNQPAAVLSSGTQKRLEPFRVRFGVPKLAPAGMKSKPNQAKQNKRAHTRARMLCQQRQPWLGAKYRKTHFAGAV